MAANLFTFGGVRSLVVGGASGMGAATAWLVAELGGDVVVMDVKDPVDRVGNFVRVDLRDRTNIDAALGGLEGPVGALFLCAGVAEGTAGLPLINFVGQRHLVETMLRHDQLRPGASVAMIASIGGMGWETQMSLLTELLVP